MRTTPTGTLRAGIYARISDDSAGKGLGVERQEKAGRALLKRQGWKLHRVYVDNDISAFKGKVRPEYLRLLEDVQAGAVQVVVAWHPDRLHRSPRELEHFIDVVEAAHAQVATVQGGHYDLSTASGRMTARIVGAVSRGESEHKSERQLEKHKQLAEQGKDVGAGRPFGFEHDRRALRAPSAACRIRDRAEILIDEPAMIREAATRTLQGDTLRGICRDWTLRGVPTVQGAKWSPQVLRRILGSARVSGRREVRTHDGHRSDIGEIISTAGVDPMCGGILSHDVSDQLRDLLSDPTRRKNSRAREYLLTGGMARCGLCGKPLVARPRGDHRRSMVCASGPGFNGCGKIRSLADPLEELVTEAVLQAIDGGALAAAMHKTDDPLPRQELLHVEAKLLELSREWAADRITRKEWYASREALVARQTDLQRRLEAQRRHQHLDGLPDQLRASWPSLPLHRRRGIIAVLVDQVVVGPAVQGRNFFDPERVQLRWKV